MESVKPSTEPNGRDGAGQPSERGPQAAREWLLQRAPKMYHFEEFAEMLTAFAASRETALSRQLNHETYVADKAEEERNAAEGELATLRVQWNSALKGEDEALRAARRLTAELAALRTEVEKLTQERDEARKERK